MTHPRSDFLCLFSLSFVSQPPHNHTYDALYKNMGIKKVNPKKYRGCNCTKYKYTNKKKANRTKRDRCLKCYPKTSGGPLEYHRH